VLNGLLGMSTDGYQLYFEVYKPNERTLAGLTLDRPALGVNPFYTRWHRNRQQNCDETRQRFDQ
jgi:hypothetical protein